MSCSCSTTLETCDSCNPCNCCPPAPPLPLPECPDPEPCEIALDAQCVLYSGPDLPCIGIDSPSNYNDIIIAIDQAVCNAGIGTTFVGDSDCIHLSGTGTESDPIIGDVVVAPQSEALPYNLLECTPDGLATYLYTDSEPACVYLSGNGSEAYPLKVELTLGSGLLCDGGELIVDTNIIPQITADNGLTKTFDNIQLGGPLIQNTTIDLAGFDITIGDSTPVKVSTIELTGNKLTSTLNYVDLGYINTVQHKYGVALGHSNTLNNPAYLYSFAAGVSNFIEGNSSFAIGESNQVTSSCAGALGCNNVNDSYLSFILGYDNEIESYQTGLVQTGIFNDVNAIDYVDYFGSNPGLAFSVGIGIQVGDSPANRMNGFHVFRNGFVKSRDGYDSRAGKRGVLPPQWSNTGWQRTAPLGSDFVAGEKYIINTFTAGDDFSNILVGGTLLWGSMNTAVCVFIAGTSGSANTWTTSTIIKVGRPLVPVAGEMGFNLDAGQMEYFDGSSWIQF